MTVEQREQRWAEAMRAERRGEASPMSACSRKLRRPCVGRLRRVSFARDSARMRLKIWSRKYSSACTASGTPGIRRDHSCHGCTRSHATSSSTSRAAAGMRRGGGSICLSRIGSKSSSNLPMRPIARCGRWIGILPCCPSGQRKIVRAIAVEGASVRNVALGFATSEGVVRMTIHRAIGRLLGAADSASTIEPSPRNEHDQHR